VSLLYSAMDILSLSGYGHCNGNIIQNSLVAKSQRTHFIFIYLIIYFCSVGV
jgi:hypothetical protein